MKLKTMLATAAIATVASTAVMAEGIYVGSEYGKSKLGSDFGKLSGDAITFYTGYDLELDNELKMDARLSYVDTDYTEYFIYSAEVSKEFGNVELYGNYAYGDFKYGITGSDFTLGARYNFN